MRAWLFIVVSLIVGPAQARTVSFVTEEFPPVSYTEHGKAAGPMAEIVHAACARLKWECPIDVIPWRRALSDATDGKAQGIFSVLRIPEREAVFHITAPVLDTAYVLYTGAENPTRYTMPQDIADYTVGAYGPSGTSHTLNDLAKLTSINVNIEIDNPTALKKLASGRYGAKSAVLINRSVGDYLIKKENLTGLIFMGTVKPIQYSYGFSRKSDEAIFKEFDAAISELKRAGDIDRIARRYGFTGSK